MKTKLTLLMLAALVLPVNAESDASRRRHEFDRELERAHERREEGFRQDRNEQIARDAAAQRERQIVETERVRREVERVRVEAERIRIEHNYYKPRR